MNVNSRLRELYPDSKELFDVVTTNDFDLPSSKSITQSFFTFVSGLQIDSFCMTGGQSPIGYLGAHNASIYLSMDALKVTEAIKEGR